MASDTQFSIDSEPDVYFVSRDEQDESDIFHKAFLACETGGIDPKKLPANECFKMKPSEVDIFVLGSFDTKVFRHLSQHKARLYGAPCVLQCVETSENLPENDHEIFSLCMRGASVAITGVAADKRADIVKKIQWLGGTFTKSLIKQNTHLIAQETSSQKYHAANRLGMTVLTLAWVNDSYSKAKAALFDATDKDYTHKYICQPFGDCIITSSGIKEKERIKSIIENGGGKYCGQMTFKHCTHLVVNKPEGQKYEKAKSWGSVIIVNPQWVFDCEKLNYKANENNPIYAVTREVSTPQKDKAPLPNLNDVSAIHSTTMTTHIDETMFSTRSDRRSSTDSLASFAVKERRSSDKIRHSNSDLDLQCDALLNCKVCLRGFDEKTTAELAKIITKCGGVRSLSTTKADYIVISKIDADTIEHIQTQTVPVVSADWLRDVYNTQSLAPLEPHILCRPVSEGKSAVKRRRSSIGESAPDSKRRFMLPSMDTTADHSVLDTELAEDNNQADLILSQYADDPVIKSARVSNPKLSELQDYTMTPSRDRTGATASTPVSSTPDRGDTRTHTPVSTPVSTPDNRYLEIDTPINTPAPPATQATSSQPFSNKGFVISSEIGVSEKEELCTLIRTHGGDIVDCDYEPSASSPVYSISKLLANTNNRQQIDHHILVTSIWLRMSNSESRLLPTDENALFTPICCLNRSVFKDYSFTSTRLSLYEREALSYLIKSSAGQFTDDLRRYSADGRPATTHLICDSVESAKYKAAKNWNIKIITISWVTDSLQAGYPLTVDDYQPSSKRCEAPSERRTIASLETPVHSRVQALRSGVGTAKKSRSGSPAQNKQYLSTSILDDPEKSFHMNLDMQCFDTPDRPQPKLTNSDGTPLDEAVAKYLQIAVDKHHVKTPDCSTGEVEPHSSDTAANSVLSGCVVCVSKKLSTPTANLSRLITSLGAVYRAILDSSVTHLVFQGKATEGEYRCAKRNKQLIVSPHWLAQCEKEKRKVSESLYPYNYKPEKELLRIEDSASGTPLLRKSSRPSRMPLDLESPMDSSPKGSADNHSIDKGDNDEEETQDGLAETLHVLNQIKSYMNKRLTVTKRKEAPARKLSNSMSTPALRSEPASEDTTAYGMHALETQSQTRQLVTWEDSTSRLEKQRLANGEQTELDSEIMVHMDDDFTQELNQMPAAVQEMSADYTSIDTQDLMANSSVEKGEPTIQTSTTKHPIFQFSGFKDEERDEMVQQLKDLGVMTSTSKSFDENCTHIILNKPQRNEKYLCGLVRGLWMMVPSYVSACVQSGTLLPEAQYEWGNPAANQPAISTGVIPFAAAAHRRRLCVQQMVGSQHLPFDGWKVVLGLAEVKMAQMKKILELGGAHVVSERCVPEEPSEATHTFVDANKSGLSENDLKILRRSGVQCLKNEYIPAYLMCEESIDNSKYEYPA